MITRREWAQITVALDCMDSYTINGQRVINKHNVEVLLSQWKEPERPKQGRTDEQEDKKTKT